MLVWAIAVLLGLFLLAGLILCVPLELQFHIDVRGRRSASRLRIVWLFDRVGWDLRRGRPRPAVPKPARAVRVRPLRQFRRMSRYLLGVLRTPGLLGTVQAFLRDVMRSLKIKDLAVDLKVGLADPFETGILFAFLGPLLLFLNSAVPYQVSLQPGFQDAYLLEGYSRGIVRILPILMVVALLKFAFSRPALRVAGTFASISWRGRKS